MSNCFYLFIRDAPFLLYFHGENSTTTYKKHAVCAVNHSLKVNVNKWYINVKVILQKI